jgi:predicted permease
MWIHDLRHALRLLRREPGFAGAVVLTLAVGIGATTALFALVEAVLLRPLPFDRADRLVVLRHRDVNTGLTKPDIAIGDFLDLRARQQSLESLAGFNAFHSTFFGEREPLRVDGVSATADALRALRVEAASGRILEDGDSREGAAAAMVSDEFWRTQLGSDPRVLTRSIVLGSTRHIVVGVLPAGFRFPGMARTDVVVAHSLPTVAPGQRRAGWIYALGRLRPDATLAGLQAEMAALSQQFESEHPGQNRGSRYEALDLRDLLVGDARRPLLLLMAAVAFVLLIACVNVGNLFLARTLGRHRELAVRLALGASRRQLVEQVLAEGIVLALAGAAAGLGLAAAAAPILATLVPGGPMPALEQVGIGNRVLLFALGAAAASALLFSAIASAGLIRVEHQGMVAERGATMTPGTRVAASALVALEIAMAAVLLTGAGLTLRSFSKLLAVDPGFTVSGVLTMQLSLPDGRYRDDGARAAFYRTAFDEIGALPGVETVGAAMVTPLTGNNWTAPLLRVDRPVRAGERPPEVGWQLASAGYFRALGIPLRAGRLFEPADATGGPVVILSESVIARHFPGEAAIGRRIRLGDLEAEIVGVVGDIRRASLSDQPRADLYFPFERVMSPSTTLFVRVTGEPLAALPVLRAAIRRLEPHAVMYETRTLSDVAEDSAAVTRLAMRLLTGFAAVALLLAAVGIYAVMAYGMRRRRREIGTRVALGASRARIVLMVLRQAAVITAVGLMAGTVAAIGLARALSPLLFDVTPWDPATLLGGAAVLTGVALAASYLPARRASRVDPVSVLASH